MPTADAILAGLTAIANAWRWLAVAWHTLIALLVCAFLAGRRPSDRLIAFVAIALIFSVSTVSLAAGNPFNGIVFAGLAVLLLVAALRAHPTPIRVDEPSRAAPGTALVLFGMVYPHFVVTRSWTEYAYASPIGLIPCPTLAAVIGFTLIFRNLRTTAWTVPLIVAGLLYGVVGVVVLGVALDTGLLAGALVLGMAATAHLRSWYLNHGL